MNGEDPLRVTSHPVMSGHGDTSVSQRLWSVTSRTPSHGSARRSCWRSKQSWAGHIQVARASVAARSECLCVRRCGRSCTAHAVARSPLLTASRAGIDVLVGLPIRSGGLPLLGLLARGKATLVSSLVVQGAFILIGRVGWRRELGAVPAAAISSELR